MRALDRKLLRDLWRTRAQVASIAAVLAGGMMTVVSMRGTASALERSRAEYYRAGRFAELFATVTRAPDAVRARLEAVPGVAQVTTRIVKDVRLDVPGLGRPGTGHLVSLPREDETAPLDAVRVFRGRHPVPGEATAVLVSTRFAGANRLQPGDSVVAVINERRVQLRIAGIAGAPDFLYEEAGGGLMVDERAYAIIWAPHDFLSSAMGMRGAFNDVAITLSPGAQVRRVLSDVDSILARYGGRGAYPRTDQVSHRVVENELRQIAVIGFAFPALLVAVAALLSGTVLGRLIATEREQIAVLKAFGYTNGSVARHYLEYAAVGVLLGLAIGAAGGLWVGRLYTGLYADTLRIPGLRFRLDLASTVQAAGILTLATLAGTGRAVRAAATLAPATGMQDPAPPRYRALLLDRLGMGAALPPAARMVLRGLERYPARAMLGAAGVASALAMIIGAFSLYDASHEMIRIMFRHAHRETLAVQLARPVPVSARATFARLPGVTTVELSRTVPIRVRLGGRTRTLALTGMAQDGQLQRLVDIGGRVYQLPPDGVVLSGALGRVLGARRGDTVLVELLEALETRPVVVAALVDELQSPNAYMTLDALGRLHGEGALASSVSLRVEGPPSEALFATLRAMPTVAGVTSRAAMLDSFDRMMARGFRITASFVVLFASLIAVGVVYNSARIALSERSRELASLRVLGFTTREVGAMLLGEQAVLTALAVPAGWCFGWAFSLYLVRAFATEQFRIPLVTLPATFALATVAVLLASTAAGAMMYRRVGRLDLVGVLKTRE